MKNRENRVPLPFGRIRGKSGGFPPGGFGPFGGFLGILSALQYERVKEVATSICKCYNNDPTRSVAMQTEAVPAGVRQRGLVFLTLNPILLKIEVERASLISLT